MALAMALEMNSVQVSMTTPADLINGQGGVEHEFDEQRICHFCSNVDISGYHVSRNALSTWWNTNEARASTNQPNSAVGPSLEPKRSRTRTSVLS